MACAAAPLPNAWGTAAPFPSMPRSNPAKKIDHRSSTDEGSSFQRRYCSATQSLLARETASKPRMGHILLAGRRESRHRVRARAKPTLVDWTRIVFTEHMVEAAAVEGTCDVVF